MAQNTLTRQELAAFLPSPRAIDAFEMQFDDTAANTEGVAQAINDANAAQTTATTAQSTADAAVAATNDLKGASYLTLSPDAALTNERILTAGNLIDFDDGGAGAALTVKVDKLSIAGAFTVALTLSANTTLTMPVSGTLATVAGTETLQNKTLQAPSVSGLGNYANDAAAAAGGVPVGGVYRNASVLQVRVT